MKKLLFVATEDWFIASHFLPLVRRARAEGYEVSIAARDSGALSGEGVRVFAMPFARGSLRPADLWREAGALGALVRAEQPAIVHTIALKPIALSLFAGVQGAARVFALTGRGYMAVAPKPWARLAAAVLQQRLRLALGDARAALLIENAADRAWAEAGRALPDARVALMPGAGVDPAAFAPTPEPAGPITIGVVARLVWSKGVDVLVEAVRRLHGEGLDLRLAIAGWADADNPERVSDEQLAAWRAAPGVTLHGRIGSVSEFWAGAHIACTPSRGGEGLPRSLLEAAACARPLVVSDAPGCVDFVRHGETGLITPREEPAALADALRTLAQDGALRRRLGAAARARVEAGYTERHAADAAAAIWKRLAPP